jgi:hypothetical protein
MTLVRRRVSPKVRSMKLECGSVVVSGGEPQVGGQAFAVSEQAFHRRRVGRGVPAGHRGDPVIDELDEARAGLGLQVLGVEELPVGVPDLGLPIGRDVGQDVPGSDIALDLACVSAGAAMGAIGGLATRLRRAPAGERPPPAHPHGDISA